MEFHSLCLQAYGAVAPSRRTGGKRVKAILSAAGIAMAVTALILVATQDSDVSFLDLNSLYSYKFIIVLCDRENPSSQLM